MRVVTCDEHGEQQPTFVCQHIVQTIRDKQPRGFWTADSDQQFPNAWCTECEGRVQAAGCEWTDEVESYLRVTMVCAACYEQARRLNCQD